MKLELQRKSRILVEVEVKPRNAMIALGTLATLVLWAGAAPGQQGPRCPTCPIVVPARPLDNKDFNDMRQRNARKRNFDAANAARKRAMDDEAVKLLILARDLKQKTENLGPQPASQTMEKEAAMIEFLASDLKQQMKLTVNPD